MLSLALFMLESLLTSPGWRSTGVGSNMENAITAAAEVKKIENTNGCKEKEARESRSACQGDVCCHSK